MTQIVNAGLVRGFGFNPCQYFSLFRFANLCSHTQKATHKRKKKERNISTNFNVLQNEGSPKKKKNILVLSDFLFGNVFCWICCVKNPSQNLACIIPVLCRWAGQHLHPTDPGEAKCCPAEERSNRIVYRKALWFSWVKTNTGFVKFCSDRHESGRCRQLIHPNLPS